MSIVIQPTIPLVAAQGVTAEFVLQPGTVISAQVVQLLGNDEVRISIGGQSLDVVSQVPLQPGQTLRLSVSQTADGNIGLALDNPPGSASTTQSLAALGLANLAVANAVSDLVTLAPDASAGIVAPPAVASKNQLTPVQALAVSAAAQTAATQQTSLAPLFANLSTAATSANLPPQVQQAAALVLAQRTSLDPGLTGADIQRAFEGSGLFLEASLASGSFSAPALSPSAATPDLKAALIVLRQVLATALDGAAAAPTAATPTPVNQGIAASTPTNGQQATGATLPTAVLAQGAEPIIEISSRTSSSIVIAGGPDSPTTASPAFVPAAAVSGIVPQGGAAEILESVFDFSAVNPLITPATTPADAAARAAASGVALNLLLEAVQANPLTSAGPSRFVDGELFSLLPAVTGSRLANVDDAEFARTQMPPPPIVGALPAAQPVLPATLLANTPAEAAIHHLLADTDGAIARQTLLQVASLPHQVDTSAGRLDPTAPRWNFEIPFVTPQGTAMAQFEISRDGGNRETEAATRVWRARFSLDVEPAGPVHALISLSGERTSVRMWAERPATADQLRAGVTQLSQALSRAELRPGDIVIRDGAPAPIVAAQAGHFLDRAL